MPPCKKMAIITITPEAIRELLFLPEGATLISLETPFDTPGILRLKIEGAGWDTPEGASIQYASDAVASRDENGVISVNWNLPSDTRLRGA